MRAQMNHAKHKPYRWSLWITVSVFGWSSWVGASVPQPAVNVHPTGWHAVINVPQTRLFLYRDGRLEKSFPVAVGKSLTQTPAGEYQVTAIARNPTWHVPASIQREMKAAGKPVLKVVPPGPSNPLGKVFVRFGPPSLSLGIHGTNAPSSVPGFRSHGCVRMHNPDVLDFAAKVSVGVPVSVVYQPLLLNTDANGELWLTALPDVYRRGKHSAEQVRQAVITWGKSREKSVDLTQFEHAVKSKKMRSVCLSCASSKPADSELIAAVNVERADEPERVLGGASAVRNTEESDAIVREVVAAVEALNMTPAQLDSEMIPFEMLYALQDQPLKPLYVDVSVGESSENAKTPEKSAPAVVIKTPSPVMSPEKIAPAVVVKTPSVQVEVQAVKTREPLQAEPLKSPPPPVSKAKLEAGLKAALEAEAVNLPTSVLHTLVNVIGGQDTVRRSTIVIQKNPRANEAAPSVLPSSPPQSTLKQPKLPMRLM